MKDVLQKTRKNFTATIIASIVIIISLSLIILQIVNITTIGGNATSGEVKDAAAKHSALSEYIVDQSEYEAHFITLASAVKEEEQQRLSTALLLTSIVLLLAGGVIAYIVAKLLMRPVEEAYASQERFIQDAAHELRNPLAAMSASLQQVNANGAVDEDLLRTFQRQTKRLVAINEDLLFIEKSQKLDPVACDVSELIEEVIEELQPIASRKKIKLELATDPRIVKRIVPTDYVRMVKNIVENAIKYSPSTSIVQISQEKIKNTIRITVKDSGIGIPSEELEHIGERFYRAKNVGTVDGTGLGFAIVAKIIRSYNGSFEITSKLSKGTTVTVNLPT